LSHLCTWILIFLFTQGVCATGKSTLGASLAQKLCVPFVDGDDLHPAANVVKMSQGTALTDEDRLPWLARIRSSAAAQPSGCAVIACSALKRQYREELRQDPVRCYFVYIKAEREMLKRRIEERKGHFMKVNMLDGQLKTLEDPEEEEGVVTVYGEDDTETQVDKAAKWLRANAKGLEDRMGIGR
jgi:gluconokinase